jgi:neprilysin
MPREARRNVTALYNPMTIGELSQLVPDVPWLEYINRVLAPLHQVTEGERVIVDTPNYFTNLTVLLAKTPKR